MRSLRAASPRMPGWSGSAASSSARSEAIPYRLARNAGSAAAAWRRSGGSRVRNAAALPRADDHKAGSRDEKSARIESRHVHRRSRERVKRGARFGGRPRAPGSIARSSIDSFEDSRWSAREGGLRRDVRSPERPIDRRRVRAVAETGLDALQEAQEERLEGPAEPLRRELDRARRVAQDLPRLEPRGIVEEPAAARVHEEGVALEEEQVACRRALLARQAPHRV